MPWQLVGRSFGTSCRAHSTLSRAIVDIKGATFYRRFPSSQENDSTNPAIFPSLSFELGSEVADPHRWAIIGPSNSGKTTLCEVLRGQHICLPPAARTFPHLGSHELSHRLRNPLRALKYVGFNGERGENKMKGRGAYLSARYESRREETDFSVKDYIQGHTELNPMDQGGRTRIADSIWENVVRDLKLETLIDMSMGNLSNGQTRRARIARALFEQPLVLLLDEPFVGLDPPTVRYLSTLLRGLAEASAPKLVLALRPQDPLPDWITHVIHLGKPLRITAMKTKDVFLAYSSKESLPHTSNKGSDDDIQRREDQTQPTTQGEVLMSMQGVKISYGPKVVLGNWVQEVSDPEKLNAQDKQGLWWHVTRGQRWGVFGPNGSGKTTLISLICSDHPQAYSQPVEIFGRSRLPRPGLPGISIFDIQARIGQSCPEIHAFFPRRLSLRQTLENAWADTFLGTPRAGPVGRQSVEACLRCFEQDLRPALDSKLDQDRGGSSDTAWADKIMFGEVPFPAQRVALFLRAIVKKPDLVVLDEAFSGMDDQLRSKCMHFLTSGDGQTITGLSDEQALICVSHVKEEVPSIVRQWMRLPEPNTGGLPTFGTLSRPLEADEGLWKEIWGMPEF